jgi:hypothetical protein
MAFRAGRAGADQPRARPRLSGAPRARACECARVSGASAVSTAAQTSACAGAKAGAPQGRAEARLRRGGRLRVGGARRRTGIHRRRTPDARAESAPACGRPEAGGRRLGDEASPHEPFEASHRDACEEAVCGDSSNCSQACTRGRAERVAVTALLPRAGRCGGGARRSGDEALPREHDDQLLRDGAAACRLVGALVHGPSWRRLDSCPLRPDGPELVPARDALMRRRPRLA